MNLRDTAIQAARAAGQEIVRLLPQERDVHVKGFRDIVTDADMASQQVLAQIIRAAFPQHGILSEEGLKPGADADTIWVLDPIDGTTNYAHNYPCFSVSVGVVRGGVPVAGAIYDPLRDDLFSAERDAGAALNGRPIHVSHLADLGSALVGFDLARDPGVREELFAVMHTASLSIHTFRSIGSAALGLCYVAAGWLEAYFHFNLYPWDCAAGGLIAMEAGATVTEPLGAPWGYTSPRCLATNGLLHPDFLKMMRT